MADRTITINHRGAARLRGGHLWVYRSDLVAPTEVAPGALVSGLRRAWPAAGIGAVQQRVADCDSPAQQRGNRRRSAAGSSARAHRKSGAVSPADRRRQRAPGLEPARRARCDSYRVIFSEADLLPGLIVDKYNDVLSLQALTQAFDRDDLRQLVVESLAEHFPAASLVERVDPHIRELEQLPPRESQLVRGEQSKHHLHAERRALPLRRTQRAEDRRLPRSARELRRRGAICPRRSARRLHLSGRLRAASGAGLRKRHRGRLRRARRWRLPSRTSSSIATGIAAARSSGSRPTPSTC